ncbi:ABC transporter permease [Rhizobium sp. CG4]|jgi:polar amino acid transport system permease protein|uniref:ABC transporter permease n=1 Tax=Rhizobium/Agrobacterium group TaxID=227290 RepID=UPI001782738E|nr:MULTISPECIES: ABC transporter permease [Rhizobium/Agrobacterium group]MBD9387730.1 ABC transporter permease [Agrobacterium sp. AGB01]MCM2453897.1 ABC transporter permease [Rhizobium sp. CG4]MCS4242177.1 polar amino acid transport system permease protein [Rhizobium sp. BIGb0125]MDO5896082.1 ABC transporter permease [Agrobacterium sp. Azo12]
MSGLFSAVGSFWAYITHLFDPFCGPVGVFSFLDQSSIISCGPTGWGDEVAFGVKVTITLALATLPVGLIIGFMIALAAQSSEKSLRIAAGIYTTIFRGLPELLTLFIVYYGIQMLLQSVAGSLGFSGPIEINAFVAGMIALAVVFSSYSSEVLLSAFKAIPKGQYEAGDSLGLRRSRTMLLIVLPQLVRIALPGMTNLWMILLKDTSYVSIIGLTDILRQTGVAARVSKEAFFFYGLACLLFLVLAMLSSIGLGYIDRWSRKSEAKR